MTCQAVGGSQHQNNKREKRRWRRELSIYWRHWYTGIILTPDCIPDATDAEAGDTRDVIRKKVKGQRSTEVEAGKRSPQTKKGQIEESIMLMKAALMEQTKELQDIQGVKEQLMMMEKFKSSFVNLHNKSGDGDAEYDETVCCDLLY